ncbi:MAG TPA: ATP synthase F0 subunit B [Candidatus Angelobacter sp.]|nr:ATP synthase F0 subunit B [Candidatus Angelobacter sp.]
MFSSLAKRRSIPAWTLGLLALALAIPVCSGLPAYALTAAQENAAPSAQSSNASASKESAKTEAPQEDPARNSAGVKLVARLTGLDVNKAYWLCVGLNFAIVAGGLWFLGRRSIPALFKGRSASIQQRMEEARKTGEDARRRLAEVEGRLSRLDADIEEMRQEAEKAATAEEQRVMAAVEQERRRIVQSAEQEIALASNAARRDLKAFAAGLAVDLAEKKIQIGVSADQTLVREFTQQLGKDGH